MDTATATTIPLAKSVSLKTLDASKRIASRAPERPGRGMLRRAIYGGIVLAPLALFSSAYSLAVATDTQQPAFSQQFYDGLPRAKARLGDLTLADALARSADRATAPESARQLVQSANTLPPRTRATIEARAMSALIDTPYASGALRQLAFLESEAAPRRALLRLSRAVSRRDLGAAAQMAELQFLAGEFEGGLATLDQALVISSALDERIFPLLLRASQNRAFAWVLRGALAKDPVWAERLASHASTTQASGPYFTAIADGFADGSRALRLDYGAPLIDRLAGDLRPDAAFAVYEASSNSEQDVAAFGTRPLAPLDWQLFDAIETGARIVGTDDRIAELFASPRRSGDVARIMLRLRPGRHTLSFSFADTRGSGAQLSLTRVCIGEGVEGESAASRTLLLGDRVSLAFEVPEACPYQSLRLGIEAGKEAFSALVESVELESSDPAGAFLCL